MRGTLARLAGDTKGNTLALVGAALLPLTAMIGSGVDMSRAYMAKQRLQNACDSAALAGRRAMTADTMSTAVRDEAVKFFNFNFPQTTYQTSAFTPNVTRPAAGVVQVTAATQVPTVIMKLFGFTTLPIDVTCDASLNFVNTDVLLVLDVTGSMASSLSGVPKIDALRDAVMALYDALAPIQTQLEANGLRLRYGVVPYSSTVNVGTLVRGVNASYIAGDHEYQTRVANYTTPVYTGTVQPPEPPVTQIYGSAISQSDCDKFGRNVAFTGFTASPSTGGGPAPARTWTRTFANNEAAGVDWGWSGASATSGTNRSCRRRYEETDTTYTTRYRFTNYSYEAENIDVSAFKTGASVAIANNTNGDVAVSGAYDMLELAEDATGVGIANVSWNGCIEERDTVNTINGSSGYAIPSTAYDLQIDTIPSNAETRWRPMFPAIEYRRTSGTTSTGSGSSMNSAACPAAARRLVAWNRGDMQAYANGLTPTGGTYHDIGIMWGARLISAAGVFADSPGTFNGMPVSRHIIFMTDGELAPGSTQYAFHGVELNDARVTGMVSPSSTELYNRHMQRFKMACNAAKGNNASIWVIAFGTALSNELTECASNAGQASIAADRASLIARFTEIGNNIGALRLTQ